MMNDIEGAIQRTIVGHIEELQATADRRLELLKEAISVLYSVNARYAWPEVVEKIEKELDDTALGS